jgi:Fe-S oxidoreductase
LPEAVSAPLLLEPDAGFVRDLAQRAGDSFLRCYQCGTCSVVCPFNGEGLALPRKEMLLAQWGMKGELLSDPNLWVCTTCGNCARLCPREVDIPGTIMALREFAVLEGEVPEELGKAFQHILARGNPLGEPVRRRVDWTRGAGVAVPVMAEVGRRVDVLLFVECYWAYHPRGNQAAGAMARTLARLGVDFGILGGEERCVADSARTAGETGLFEERAAENVKTLSKYDFGLLVTPDPHAYNAFRRFYPRFGGEFPVQHYSQFLAGRLPQMALGPIPERRVAYHDPCYLGRHNGEYEAPRRLLQAIPGVRLVEMAHCRENGFCCGGGGGGIWNSAFVAGVVGHRLAELRVLEAVAAGAEVLAVACPFEVSLFEDAAKATGNEGRLAVRDIVELLDESLRA